MDQLSSHQDYLRSSFRCTNCNHESRQTHKVRIHGDKSNATPLAKEKTPSLWKNLSSSRTPSRSELARETHKLRIQAAKNNVTPLGIAKTPSHMNVFSKTPSRPELARQTHKLRIQAAKNNVTPNAKESTPSLLKFFSRSITTKTPSRPEFRSVAANKPPNLSSVNKSASNAIYRSGSIFKRASHGKNGTGDNENSHLTIFRSKNLSSLKNGARTSKDNTASGLFTSAKKADFTDQHISIQDSFSTVYDQAKQDVNENCEALGSSNQIETFESNAASLRCKGAPIEMMHANDNSARDFPIDRGSPSTAENTLHQLNPTYIIRNCKRFRPSSSNLVRSDLNSTNNMQTGTFEPNETTLHNATQSGHSIISNTVANLIESGGEASRKPAVSLWPSIENCRGHLQTVRDFSLPASMRVESADSPCDCCLCKFSEKNKSLTVKYCIKHPIEVRKCGRNAPYARNYRKTVLCNACRLSLNDRVSKKSKGKFKCYHENCSQIFNTKNAVISHVMDHMKLRNYPCEVCPNKFKSLSALKTHARKHLRESSSTASRK